MTKLNEAPIQIWILILFSIRKVTILGIPTFFRDNLDNISIAITAKPLSFDSWIPTETNSGEAKKPVSLYHFKAPNMAAM
jgi:hypothetical protein